MKMRKITALAVCAVMAVSLFSACKEQPAEKGGFTVTSADLSSDGVWSTAITNTSGGENKSPELTWTEVNGAEEYAVYMLDTDANNWVHWKASGIKTAHLDAGSSSADDKGGAEKNQYVGPYPPSGTHTYVVTVFALKKPADSYPCSVDNKGKDIEQIKSALDTAGGETGNVIASASISGTYSAGT